MGADFIGYMVFGPVDISKESITKAKEHVKRVKAALNDYHKEEGQPEVNESRLQKKMDKLLKLAPDPAGYGADGYDEYIDALSAALSVDEDPVASFLHFWNTGARDTISRKDPKNRKRKVVCAGDQTWGDDPDGYGYTVLKSMSALGLFDILGLY